MLSCLANLSSDEIFTPPDIANQILDLLPQEIWQDKNITFLDPAVKSGVFLREIARRLITGLEQEIPDLQTRLNHIFKNQLFGIAITEITGLIGRRTVYCSKTANGDYSICSNFENESGNILFQPLAHIWKNGKCSYCGANQKNYDRDESQEFHAYQFIHTDNPEEIFNMKFDVIISNPPYQLNDGGFGVSASPLYHKFIQQAKKLNPRYLTMIVPARWYAGGKGLDDFRKEMLKDTKIKQLIDHQESVDCFPSVEIKGGICYFLWDNSHEGYCEVTNIISNEKYTETRDLNEYDVFVRLNKALPILKKVQSKNEALFSSLISQRKPFGFPTNYSDYQKEPSPNMIRIFGNDENGYINPSKINVNAELVKQYKLLISKAYNGGYTYPHQIINKPIIAGNNSCCTETYLVIAPFQNIEQSKNAADYIATKFFRFLVFLRKITQDNTRDRFLFVPMQDFTESWNDEKLYQKYGLTLEEIAFIESKIRPMVLGDE